MGIQSLFRLVDTPDPVTVQNTVYAMGNIASARKWAKELMRHGALEAILEVYSSDRCDRSGQRASAFAIANLAAKPHSHPIFKDYLPKIIALLDNSTGDDAEICRYLSLTLLNLSANPAMILPLIANRVTSVLLNVLSVREDDAANCMTSSGTQGDTPASLAAAMEETRYHVVSCVLNFIGANHQFKMMFLSEGFIPELIGVAIRGSGVHKRLMMSGVAAPADGQTPPHRTGNIDADDFYADEPRVVTQVCAVLQLFSTLNDTHAVLANSSTVLEPVFKLITCSAAVRSVDTRRHIAALLANLTSLPEHHSNIAAADGVKMLFRFLNSGSTAPTAPSIVPELKFRSASMLALVKQQTPKVEEADRAIGLSAIRGLANLAVSRFLHTPILECGGVKQCILYLKMKDTPQWYG